MSLVGHDALAAWLGYEPGQKLRIRRALDRHGIAYTLGKDGRVCTTATAVENALQPASGRPRDIRFM